MSSDSRYNILFEPVKIGPVITKNRFYQVPHCTGMGYKMPHADAMFRGLKAEGGWGVVCCEQCSIHPTSDSTPNAEVRLWDDGDVRRMAPIADAIHKYGALAGVELAHTGIGFANRYTREVPLGPSHQVAIYNYDPMQARAMDKSDIQEFRSWQVAAAKRAKRAGFDIVYVYAGENNFALPMNFLSRRRNFRTDQYGGSLENRVRLIREMIEDTKEAVGDTCAVALRIALKEFVGPMGVESEAKEIVEILAEVPDLWDVNVSDWQYDSGPSRFDLEAYQEPYVSFVKKITTKPVVGVGRFTSPDTMVSQIRRGILDLIGCARPSIADPFLPKKVEEGRVDDIRECVGCNLCVGSENTVTPLRCCQNPTASEEWARGWHPEFIEPKGSEDRILVVGGGPAGLECARALGQRGYVVTLAEAHQELGGRVARECRLPGMAAWGRIRDYRVMQITKLPNVEFFLESRLTTSDVLEYGADRVIIATGAYWRRDGLGHHNWEPIPGNDGSNVFTPDDVIAGAKLKGPTVVFDDDHYFMGGVISEKLKADGLDVTLVTTVGDVSKWTFNTEEQHRIQRRILELGIKVRFHRNLRSIGDGQIELADVYVDAREMLQCGSVVIVTSRLPDEALYYDLMVDVELLKKSGIKSVARIGDCYGPSTVAAAVFSGHRYARELDAPRQSGAPFRWESIQP
jgi:dimethylamine/trimethylamine dehydrogenase